jgi:hypothetical protein
MNLESLAVVIHLFGHETWIAVATLVEDFDFRCFWADHLKFNQG